MPLPPCPSLLLQSEYLGTTYSLPRIDNYAIINCVSEEKEQRKQGGDQRLGFTASSSSNGQWERLQSQRQQFMAAAEAAEGSKGGAPASVPGPRGSSVAHNSTLVPNNQARRKQRA